MNNQYLHFILRSALVKEQFRKFSTGSSYPAILDSDVEKTIIPLPSEPEQATIAKKVKEQTDIRNKKIFKANKIWNDSLNECLFDIQKMKIRTSTK